MGPPLSGLGSSGMAADVAMQGNGQTEQQQQPQQTTILRNPLRGSKCKFFGDFVRTLFAFPFLLFLVELLLGAFRDFPLKDTVIYPVI